MSSAQTLQSLLVAVVSVGWNPCVRNLLAQRQRQRQRQRQPLRRADRSAGAAPSSIGTGVQPASRLASLNPVRRQVNSDLGALVDRSDGLGGAVDAMTASHVIDFEGDPLDLQWVVEQPTVMLPAVGGSSLFG